jgi:hypothetical protein
VDHNVIGCDAAREEVGTAEHAGNDGRTGFVGIGDEDCPYREEITNFEGIWCCGEEELQLDRRKVREGLCQVKRGQTEMAAESSLRST